MAPEFSIHPSVLYSSRIGDQLKLACSATGIPPPLITWRFDGQTGFTLSDYVSTSDGVSILTIPKIRKVHEGSYHCIASNTVGQVETTSTVDIETPPVIKARVNTTISTKQGSAITFDCHAEGDPQPIYSWTHNHVKVVASGHYIMTKNGTLTIQNVNEGDAGEVRCTAHNQVKTKHFS